MSSNPKKSAWYSTPADKRKRKISGFTLSDEARERLDLLAAERMAPLSKVVEDLIMDAPLKGKS